MVRSKHCVGYSLLELLIALSLGLMLVFTAYGLIISFNQSDRNLQEHLYHQSQMNHLFEVIGFFIFNAGYADPIKQSDNDNQALNYQFINDGSPDKVTQALLDSLPSDLNKILPIQITPDASVHFSNQQSPVDDFVTCDGYKVKHDYMKHTIINIFWFDGSKIPCQSIVKTEEANGWKLLEPESKKKIIVDGVSDFNVKVSYKKSPGITIEVQLAKKNLNQGVYSTFFKFNNQQ